MFSVSNKMIEKVCRKMLKDKIKKAFPWDNACIIMAQLSRQKFDVFIMN